jgi:DNA mismatch repair protein MutS2
VNRHALEVLEFPRVLEVVAGQARTELGAERVRELHPRSDTAWIEMEHARVVR